ncbi:hypothetical protein PaG_00871 [Moesziomyces aphidis]|uniref:Uncharacterized protein n=1 Tax=Moesziomyces aphidis TaxID=84754 RepID=W3VVQ2_MOEAP|nr:hypothetical protein PaG_00871 [Moesziomyces aphidis]
MVRFKTRWLLLSIDDKPLACTSPFGSMIDKPDSESTSSSTAALYSAARQPASALGPSLTPQLITRLLRASLVYNFGDVASGAFGGVLTCKYYSPHTGTAIVRCSRDAARLVWASATLLSSPIEAEVGTSTDKLPSLRMRVVHCGGTIKKVQNKAIELDTKLILRLRARQKKLATNAANGQKKQDVKTTVVQEVQPQVVKLAPVLGDDEDLGEALDANAAEPPTTKLELPVHPTAPAKANQDSKSDAETQALIARSRKEINSISH